MLGKCSSLPYFVSPWRCYNTLVVLSEVPRTIYHPDTSALANKNNTDEQAEGLFGVWQQLD